MNWFRCPYVFPKAESCPEDSNLRKGLIWLTVQGSSYSNFLWTETSHPWGKLISETQEVPLSKFWWPPARTTEERPSFVSTACKMQRAPYKLSFYESLPTIRWYSCFWATPAPMSHLSLILVEELIGSPSWSSVVLLLWRVVSFLPGVTRCLFASPRNSVTQGYTVKHDRKVAATGAWDGWSPCICIQKVETTECLCAVHFSFLCSPGHCTQRGWWDLPNSI